MKGPDEPLCLAADLMAVEQVDGTRHTDEVGSIDAAVVKKMISAEIILSHNPIDEL